ncbi:MAG TPA: phasin family protein [Telluria sp.]|nr:phasin family protein [Telluria sp.]
MQSFATHPALKSHLDTQLNFMTELSQKSLDATRQVAELNMQMARQMIDVWINLGRSMLQTSDPFQLTSATFRGFQPAAEQLRNYQQRLMGVLTSTQAELTRSAQAGIPEASRSASAMADAMVRSAAASAGASAHSSN